MDFTEVIIWSVTVGVPSVIAWWKNRNAKQAEIALEVADPDSPVTVLPKVSAKIANRVNRIRRMSQKTKDWLINDVSESPSEQISMIRQIDAAERAGMNKYTIYFIDDRRGASYHSIENGMIHCSGPQGKEDLKEFPPAPLG